MTAICIVEDILAEQPNLPSPVVTIGSFDGVHRGHQRILEEVVRQAKSRGGTPVVLTMQPHPREFFSPNHAPNLLTSDRKKVELFAEAGIEAVFFLPFNQRIASMPPVEFAERIVAGQCGAASVVVGHDFRFGRGAEGDFNFLRSVAPGLGFEVSQVDAMLIKGERVSSTVIRERVLQGDLDEAELFLGRKYSIMGEVVEGRGMGRRLGYPTANVRPHHRAVPPHGVYAARTRLSGAHYPAAVNIGIAPTIRHEDITIEAFLLDFKGELVGKEIEVIFHKRLRPEQKFASVQDLIRQIDRDVEQVRACLT
jgi:riboflavin kinase/FMN adenylyltransferase